MPFSNGDICDRDFLDLVFGTDCSDHGLALLDQVIDVTELTFDFR